MLSPPSTSTTSRACTGMSQPAWAAAKTPRTEIDRYKVGVFPIDITVGDFNRDRRADLAVSIFQAPSGTNFPISILRGTRKGTFRKTRGVRLDQTALSSCRGCSLRLPPWARNAV